MNATTSKKTKDGKPLFPYVRVWSYKGEVMDHFDPIHERVVILFDVATTTGLSITRDNDFNTGKLNKNGTIPEAVGEIKLKGTGEIIIFANKDLGRLLALQAST